MLIALLVTGAASEARGLPIPGTKLELGMPMARADSLAHLRATPGNPNHRKGDAKYFGLDADAEADFSAGRMTRVRFTVPAASAHSRDYIEDQLRNAGLHRSCDAFDAKSHNCVWTKDLVVRVVWTPGRLTADATPAVPEPPSESAGEPDSAAALAALAAHEARADSARSRSVAGGGSPVAAPASGAASGATSSAAGGAATVAASASPVALGGAAVPGIAMPMLADTLRLSGPFSPASAITPDVRGVRPGVTYPPAARAAGIQGTVLVLATVDTAGTVIAATILRSIPELDDSALDSARNYRFSPLLGDGRATGFRVVIPCTFTPHGP